MKEEHLKSIMNQRYKKIYSERLDKYVYVLRGWVPKDTFKKYKQLFGYCDVGWTVKHPKTLIKLLIEDQLWDNPYEFEELEE